MIPQKFPECNTIIGPPRDLHSSQCMTIPAYMGRVQGGSLDDAPIVVVAWMPTPEELKLINEGKPIFVSFLGGLAPHYPCMSFEIASKPV